MFKDLLNQLTRIANSLELLAEQKGIRVENNTFYSNPIEEEDEEFKLIEPNLEEEYNKELEEKENSSTSTETDLRFIDIEDDEEGL